MKFEQRKYKGKLGENLDIQICDDGDVCIKKEENIHYVVISKAKMKQVIKFMQKFAH